MSAVRGRARVARLARGELLESRTLLSAQVPGVVVGITPGSTGAGLSYGPVVETVDGGTMVHEGGVVYAVGPLSGPQPTAASAAPAPAASLDIVLKQGPNLAANAEASAAFEQAAQFYESMFKDPVTVVIDAEIAPLGGNTLGLANSVLFGQGFDSLRNRMVADADPAGEAFVSPSAACAAPAPISSRWACPPRN
jgi:hypothetical protein